MNKILIYIFLFCAFFAYRLHFWDYQLAWHIFLNAFADVSVSILCGILIYFLNSRYKGNWIFLASMLFITGFSFLLFLTHKLIYVYSEMLVDNFYHMFHALCYQLLDSCSIIITGSLAYLLFLLSLEKTVIQKNLETLSIAKDKEELKYLKTRVNPHFIFNGLNSIYHEIDSDTTYAKDRLLQFSAIFRYHLKYASMEKVSFEVELKYLKSYIKFQQQSTADFLHLEQNYSIENKETEIAPLLLIPFLENAFKYCSSSRNEKGNISIHLKCNQSRLVMEIENNYDPSCRDEKVSNGFGIKNVIKRLDLHYSGNYKLDLKDSAEEELYTCTLEITL